MIGQTELLGRTHALLGAGKYPRFSLFVGPTGSGRRTIVRSLARELGEMIIEVEPKAGPIRDMMEQAYRVVAPTVYIIPNADDMSVVAKNTLLKFTEEPPQNAYIMMTARDAVRVLDTIRSRAMVFHMDTYTPAELIQFIGVDADQITCEKIISICDTPLDIQTIKQYDIDKFFDFIALVTDNVEKVSGANSFKIGAKLDLSAGENTYSLSLFWKAFIHECVMRFQQDPVKYGDGVRITDKYLRECDTIPSANRTGTFDMWLLDIRRAWM